MFDHLATYMQLLFAAILVIVALRRRAILNIKKRASSNDTYNPLESIDHQPQTDFDILREADAGKLKAKLKEAVKPAKSRHNGTPSAVSKSVGDPSFTISTESSNDTDKIPINHQDCNHNGREDYDFDLRKAVILSEILKPKFDDEL